MIVDLPTAAQVAARAAWLAALRSGEYPRGRRALRTDAGFCCLGVAEDVARGRDAWRRPTAEQAADYRGLSAWCVPGDDADVPRPDEREDELQLVELGVLTASTRARLGLVEADPHVLLARRCGLSCVGECVTSVTLTELNDSERLDLTAIAAVIEDQAPDWDGSFERVQADWDRRAGARHPGSWS